LGAAKKNEWSIPRTVSHLSHIPHPRYLDTAADIIEHHKIAGNAFIHLAGEPGKAGLAEVYRGTPAKGQNMEPYWKAEEEARKAGKGMWVQGDKYVSPREWRKTHGN
jgi:hypothetical protein